ncbi:hypothetical protein [Candidatus Symbiothrix dinenymphae]|uniref:hypothetical protein n=1 Tax=Candidatus Symbiothrix dinenymphae TaxID=467085 RepID=UPI0006E3254C|nr:hypothetical protein [Candidatus Symbiothrix dinenymphae]
MKTTMKYFAFGILALGFVACEDDKTYNGPAQIAFASKTATYSYAGTVADTTIVLSIQLIADAPQRDIAATVAVDAASTAVATVPASATIPAGRYAAELPVTFTYAQLNTGVGKLILSLTSDVKVAANYDTLTVTITKW